MIQGRSLAAYPEITVVARLSASRPADGAARATGSPRPSFGPSDAATVALVIDQVVQ